MSFVNKVVSGEKKTEKLIIISEDIKDLLVKIVAKNRKFQFRYTALPLKTGRIL